VFGPSAESYRVSFGLHRTAPPNRVSNLTHACELGRSGRFLWDDRFFDGAGDLDGMLPSVPLRRDRRALDFQGNRMLTGRPTKRTPNMVRCILDGLAEARSLHTCRSARKASRSSGLMASDIASSGSGWCGSPPRGSRRGGPPAPRPRGPPARLRRFARAARARRTGTANEALDLRPGTGTMHPYANDGTSRRAADETGGHETTIHRRRR